MTLVLRRGSPPSRGRGRPKRSLAVAWRWWRIAQEYGWQYALARLEKRLGRTPRATPTERARERTASKLHVSEATVKRAVRMFEAGPGR